MINKLFFLISLISIFFSYCIAQAPAQKDSVPTFMIEGVVVTADRMENTIANTTSSVSLITGQELQHMPVQKLSDVLQAIPGFFITNKDGLGREPMVSSRGFYGGGEAEYCLVLVDNKPVNDVETGLVNWNLVPLGNISSIEVSRGTSSPLYGDASLGGIVNIMTNKSPDTHTTASLQGGSFDSYDLGIQRSGTLGSMPYQIYFSNEKTNGYRVGSGWRGTSGGADLSYPIDNSSTLKLSSLNQWNVSNDPGPLTEGLYMTDAKSQSPYYKADGGNERRNQLQASYVNSFTTSSELTSVLYYNYKKSDIRRTFENPTAEVDEFFQPIPNTYYDTTDFGDTKQRDLTTHEAGLNLNYRLTSDFSSMRNRFIVGSDASLENAISAYHGIFEGFEGNYASAGNFQTGSTIVSGHASRQKYAFFVNDELRVVEPITLTIGARYDQIHDVYRGDKSSSVPDTTMSSDANAFSPKIGVNYHYINEQSVNGSFYASWNRSFKAPTVDQLSDQRPIDVMLYSPLYQSFFPYSVSFSNMSLKPQRGNSYELGSYHRFKISDDLYSELTVDVYQIDMKDEIDFDFSTYRYGNINESRHRGIEAGLKVYLLPNITGSVNYTMNDVRFRAGDNNGHYLKGIPHDVWGIDLGYQHPSGVKGNILLTSSQKTYLDDENTKTLSNFTTVNAKVSYLISPLTIFVESDNVFDRKYSSTGYLLYGTTYLYPAAGRSFFGGVEIGF